MTLTPHPVLVPWSRKSRAMPLLLLWAVWPVQSLSACTVQLYLYSPYGPYGLYRASVPVQYSSTSTPPMGRTACTEPQCLYNDALFSYLRFHVLGVSKTSGTLYVYIRVKCSLYRPGVAQRVGRGIAVLFHDRGTRRG